MNSSYNPNCRDCELWKTAGTVCVSGEGNPKAPLLIIGEAPGGNEARTGRPFTGRSGQLLRSELHNQGITDFYITNVVKCRPPDNRTPTPKEVKACRKYLDAELTTIQPKYVLTLGALASKQVLKKAKITEAHGQLIDMGTFTGMPAYHPAYCLRDPSKLPALQHDLARLARAMRGEINRTPVKWEVVNAKNVERFIYQFRDAKEFSFDLETSGLFQHDGKGFIRCIGIGLREQAWVLPLEMPDSPYGGKRWKAQKRIIRLLTDLAKGKWIVAQNGKFDNLWLERYYGRRFRISLDTMLADHVLNENQPHDLKYMARTYLDVEEYDIPLSEKKGQGKDPQTLYEYCAKDAFYTLQLAFLFRKKLQKDPELNRLFEHLVMPGARVMEDVELQGITLDMERYAEIEEQVKTELQEIEADLQRMARRPVNWNAPPQVAKLLYEDLGLKCTVFTDKGAPSTGENALVDLKGKHPIVDKLISYREQSRFLSTYIGDSSKEGEEAGGWRPYIVEGQLYLSYKIHGTVTGRYSSRLHQIPRDGTIRNLGIAPPGWSFVQGDLSQAELRVAAVLSRDPELITCFLHGPDIHWRTLIHNIGRGSGNEYEQPTYETGRKLLKNPRATLTECLKAVEKAGPDTCIALWGGWKEARKRAKAVNFGFIYGMYEDRFIQTARTKYGWEPTWDEAHAIRESYFQLYSRLPDWHNQSKRIAHLNGYITSLCGRKRRLPGIVSGDREVRGEAERQSINSPVQGFIGDYKVMAMIEIHEKLPRDRLLICGEHHDALLMIVENTHLDETLTQVKRIMEKPALLEIFGIELPIPMEVGLEVGPWGKGKSWHEGSA